MMPPDALTPLLAQAGALQAEARHGEAIGLLRQAVAQAPEQPHPRFLLAHSLLATGAAAEAEALYRAILPTHPRPGMVLANLAAALAAQKRMKDAEAAAERALTLNPRLGPAHTTLAFVYLNTARPEAAERSAREALALGADSVEVRAILATALLRQHRLPEGLAAYREGVAAFPASAELHSGIPWMLNDTEGLTPEAVFAEHVAWGQRHTGSIVPFTGHANGRDPERTLRVGLITQHLRAGHPAATFMTSLFRDRDRTQVALWVYWVGDAEDAVTARFRGWSDRWIAVPKLGEAQLAERIRADGIDILLERGGHGGSYCRLLTYAYKPAPIQVAWMGYQNTRGMAALDYFLGDALACPPEVERHFVERVYRLPGPMVAYQPEPPPPEGPLPPLPALASGAVTFGVFTRAVKVQPGMVALWARLLGQLPRAQLVLRGQTFMGQGVQSHLRAVFAEHGVAPERVAFWPAGSRPQFLADLARIDILLDPFPNTGVTITLDAAWMGVPTVSLRGETCVSRMGYSVLTHLGHPEWVGATAEEYLAIAERLAADIPALARLRTGLREQLRASPLGNGPAHARQLEAAFRDMWRAWCGALR